MAASENTPPCREHPPLVILGTLTEWRALCKECTAMWRSADPETPIWVREQAHATFEAITRHNTPPGG